MVQPTCGLFNFHCHTAFICTSGVATRSFGFPLCNNKTQDIEMLTSHLYILNKVENWRVPTLGLLACRPSVGTLLPHMAGALSCFRQLHTLFKWSTDLGIENEDDQIRNRNKHVRTIFVTPHALWPQEQMNIIWTAKI